MKSYLSIREAAEKWGVSQRRINQYCSEGRIPGAQRFGKSWAIPEDAEKPVDPRQSRRQAQSAPAEAAAGGPIALVEEGDIIAIDIDAHSVTLKVSEEELARRRAAWKPVKKPVSGYLKRYARLVTSADRGAVLEDE